MKTTNEETSYGSFLAYLNELQTNGKEFKIVVSFEDGEQKPVSGLITKLVQGNDRGMRFIIVDIEGFEQRIAFIEEPDGRLSVASVEPPAQDLPDVSYLPPGKPS